MRLACFGYPHLGGTHTVFVSLRRGLARHGIELRWLGVGPGAGRAAADPAWRDEAGHGEAIDLPGAGDASLARAMAVHLDAAGYDGVLVNVLASRVQMNAVRHLRPDLRRIMLVHNITPGTYAAARALRDRVDATVGVSARIRDDLVARHGFDAGRTLAIANAADLAAFPPRLPATPSAPLRLLWLGRLEEAAKGILWLPAIMARLPASAASLTVAGDGPDRARLEQRCHPLADRIHLVGRVAPADVPALLAAHDVLLMPSRFEGLPQTLVEAMAAGCVPVASRLRGVTDSIVEDGRSGLLFPVGAVADAAAAIAGLAGDRARLEAMAEAAGARARTLFGQDVQAAAYARLIGEVMARPPAAPPPLPWDAWSYPAGLRPGLRTWLPEPVKNVLRTWLERSAA